MRQTISSVALEIMDQEKHTRIDMGSYGLLDEIYSQCVKRGIIRKVTDHPMDRQAYIMHVLRHSKHWKIVGHINYPGFAGYNNCAVVEPIR